MPWWWPFAVGAALLISLILTPLIANLAQSFGLIDAPSEPRKFHDRPTPLLGGLAIYAAFWLPTLAILLTSNHFTAGEIDLRHFLGFLLGASWLTLGGYLDDKFNLPPRLSFLFPIGAAILAVSFGIGVDKITNPLGGALVVAPLLSTLLTFGWLLGMTYTTKLLDGVDGLATGVTIIGAVMIASLAVSTKFFQPDVALLAAIFTAALVGFWLWNFPPARIFLGEGGSTFLGFTLGVLAVIAGSKLATTLLVVGIPALDVGFVMLRRLWQGRSIVAGDRSHLHFLLLQFGLSARQILVIYMVIATAFGVTTLLFNAWQKLIALGALVVITSLGIVWLYRKVNKQTKYANL